MTVARHEFIDGTRFADLGDICFSDQHMNPRSISEQLLNQQLERHVDTDRLPIIYVSSDHVTQLFAACENVKHEFVLLSHNGDTTFTGTWNACRHVCVIGLVRTSTHNTQESLRYPSVWSVNSGARVGMASTDTYTID